MTDLRPVQSSNIAVIGYDPQARKLTVRFKAKNPEEAPRTYHHHGVSQEQYEALLGEGVEGHSIGHHYHQHIRGRVETVRQEDEPKP